MRNAEIRKSFEEFILRRKEAARARIAELAKRDAEGDVASQEAFETITAAALLLEQPVAVVLGKYVELHSLNRRLLSLPAEIAGLEKARPAVEVGRLEKELEVARKAVASAATHEAKQLAGHDLGKIEIKLGAARKRFDALRDAQAELRRLSAYGPVLPWKMTLPPSWTPPQPRSPFVAAGRAAFEEVSSCQ